jgi:hypothetical protein
MGALIYSYYCGYGGVFPSVAAPKADALPPCATPHLPVILWLTAGARSNRESSAARVNSNRLFVRQLVDRRVRRAG